MKLFERLGLKDVDGVAFALSMLQSAERESPKTEFEMAWNKLNRSDRQGLVALGYYLQDDRQNAALHARACLKGADEFLFGIWRSQFKTPDGNVNPCWWKEKFTWMEVFSQCLLWGSALGEWDILKRTSEFPEEEACLSMGTKPQDRDALVAIAGLLKGESNDKCVRHINRLSAGPKKGGKLLSEALRSLLDSDSVTFNKNLATYLQHYKKGEFPKEDVTKKISIEGTLMVHWARHRGMKVEVPSQFEDHIVKLEN